MRSLRRSAPLLVVVALLAPTVSRNAAAQESEQKAFAIDSDHDGMSDALEQALLIQFAPTFMVGRHDCSEIPAEFAPNMKTPTVKPKTGPSTARCFRQSLQATISRLRRFTTIISGSVTAGLTGILSTRSTWLYW
jgi:hypothetical protein